MNKKEKKTIKSIEAQKQSPGLFEMYYPAKEMTIMDMLTELKLDKARQMWSILVNGKKVDSDYLVITPSDDVKIIPHFFGASEPTSTSEFSQEQALELFNSLMHELRGVIGGLYNRPFTDDDLSEFLGLSRSYIRNFRYNIKSETEGLALATKEFFQMKEVARIKIIKYSNEINRDLSEELNTISRLFNSYKDIDYYSNVRNNPLYLSLAEFQYSLTVIFKSIDEISSYSIVNLEREISMNLRYFTYKAKKDPSTEITTRKYVKLYNTLKINYKTELKQHGLEQEFERIFFDLFKTFKDHIIRPEYKNIVRGRLLQDINDLLPEDFYIDRNIFSKLIFGDEYYLMSAYFHKDKLFTYPKTQIYNKMEANIRSIKTDSAYLYAGKPLSQTNLNDLKTEILKLTGLYKEDFSSSKSSLPERVLRYYMEYLFGGNFEKDSAVSWITTVGGSLGELDGHEKELHIACEFNGPQHYKLSHWIEVYGLSESVARKRFYIQNINDLNKLMECQKKDTVLIVLSSLDNPSDWQDIIVHQYELWTGKKAPVKHPLDYESVLRLISEEDIGTLKARFLKNFSC